MALVEDRNGGAIISTVTDGDSLFGAFVEVRIESVFDRRWRGILSK
jgi:hypothetical protein